MTKSVVFTVKVGEEVVYKGIDWAACREALAQAHKPENKGKMLALLRDDELTNAVRLF